MFSTHVLVRFLTVLVTRLCPRVTEFGDFEHVFTCVDLSYGAKIAF